MGKGQWHLAWRVLHAVSRFILIALFLTVLVAIATGCNMPVAEKTPSAAEIVTNCIAAQKQANTYRCEIRIDTDVQASGTQSERLTMSALVKGTIDLLARKMKMDTDTSVTLAGKKSTARVALFVIEDTLYLNEDTPTSDAQWTARKLTDAQSQAVWTEQTGQLSGGKYTDILANSQFQLVTVEERNGVASYQLQVTPDMQTFSNLLQEQLSQSMSDAGALPTDVANMFQNVNITYWVARDSYNLIEYRISAGIATEVQGKKMQGQMNLNGRFYDYGAKLAIEPPAEALAAK